MDRRPHRYAIKAAVAAIPIAFTLCANAVAGAEQASAHASLQADQSSSAEAAYADALKLAQAGHNEEAIPLLQRALTITRTQYGLFDLRQQDVLKSLRDKTK